MKSLVVSGGGSKGAFGGGVAQYLMVVYLFHLSLLKKWTS